MLKKHNPIGNEEVIAVTEVLNSGILSDFLGSDGDKFYGGKYVRQFEEDICTFFKVKNAISVNSWTSGLICAVGSLDIEPGDEIITTPFTMCATAASILHWNAIPVFADIDPRTFCISPESIQNSLSERTKAIICVDIFGQSSSYEEIRSIIPKNIKIISDTAQAPGSFRNGKFSGTLGDIGGFSFNYHKHIHTGEGGVIVTNDDYLAERCRLIRNHAEAVIENRPNASLSNMIGFNFRMGEIEAAIGSSQLNKLEEILRKRKLAAKILNMKLANRNDIQIPYIDKGNDHVYYMYPILLSDSLSREIVFKKLVDKGIEGLAKGYTNIHRLPIFEKKQAYGNSSIPWSLGHREIEYGKGTCPIAESYYDHHLITLALNHFDIDESDANNIADIINEVLDSI